MTQPILSTTCPYREAYDAMVNLCAVKPDMIALFGQPPSGVGASRWVLLDSPAYFAPNPDLDNLLPADFPRVKFCVTEAEFDDEADSCSSQDTLIFEIEVQTGSQQQGLILDCMWAIRRAMANWRQYVEQQVTWNGKICIFDVDSKPATLKPTHVEGENTEEMPKDSRGYEQWVKLWRKTVRFYFQTTDLINH